MSTISEQTIAALEDAASMMDLTLSPLLRLAEKQTSVFNKGSAGWLRELRLQGAYRVAHSTFPTRRDEDWRVTDISVLKRTEFHSTHETAIQTGDVTTFLLPETQNARVVFVNGVYAPHFSDVSALPEGVFVGNLAALSPEKGSELVNYLGQQSRDLDVFAALNDAGLRDVAVIWVDKNVVVKQPIHVLFVGKPADQPIALQSRCVAIAETGSSINIVEYYGATASGCSDRDEHLYFNNAVTEIYLKPNAQVQHIRIQREAGAGVHIGNTAITQAQDSRYHLTDISMGAKLNRHSLTVNQTGVQTETILKGLTLVGGTQISDTHTTVQLNHPYGTVDQLHKCVIDGSARSVFNGKVNVPQAAQMTNAAQLNRNLLLSPNAHVDTKPELCITADNVKCAHGATVSQLEADEIFYLRSRGLNEYDARHLLLDAFAAEILDTITLESLHQSLTGCVSCRTAD